MISANANKFEKENEIGSLTLLDCKAFCKGTKIERSLSKLIKAKY